MINIGGTIIMTKKIDINCDMGESYGRFIIGNDEEVMPYVTSANIACGFHGGDPCTIQRTVDLAAKLDVNIGAHPSFPDLVGFGRREMKLSYEEIKSYTLYQIGALKIFADIAGKPISHIKPHGSLYNVLCYDNKLAEAFIEAIVNVDPECSIYHIGSIKESAIAFQCEKKGIRLIREFNADTDYADDGSIAIKKVHEKVDAVKTVERVVNFLEKGEVIAVNGKVLKFKADSICVHGDNPSAIEVLTFLRKRLTEIGYEITAP